MSYFAHKRVLVTGGTGFVGSHLVESLAALGAHVFVVTRTAYPAGYFCSQGLHKKTTMLIGDVKDAERMIDIVTSNEISIIFHLAAQPLVVPALVNPRETLATNILGTVNMLEAARISPWIESVIIASSDKAYGMLDRPYREDDPLVGKHPYEVSKSSADLIAQTYAETYKLPVVITRFGNIYGEGDLHPSRVIPGMMFAILRGEPFQIRSNGKYTRAYVYVKDVVDGYLMLAERASELKGQAFNFGSDDVYSVLDLIRVFEEALGRTIVYTIRNTATHEIPTQSLSYEKAKTILGWAPKRRLPDMASSIYAWYESSIFSNNNSLTSQNNAVIFSLAS